MTMPPQAHCLKCQAPRPVHNPRPIEMEGGRTAQKGNCPVCQNEMISFESVRDERDWGDLVDYDYVTSIPAFCWTCGTAQDALVARSRSTCLVCGEQPLVKGSKSSKLSRAVAEARPGRSALLWASLGLAVSTIFTLSTPAGPHAIGLLTGLTIGILFGGIVVRDPAATFIYVIVFVLLAGLVGTGTLVVWSTLTPDDTANAPAALVGTAVGGASGVLVVTWLKPPKRERVLRARDKA